MDIKDFTGAAGDFTYVINTGSKNPDSLPISHEIENKATADENPDSLTLETCRERSYFSRGNAHYNLREYRVAIDDYTVFLAFGLKDHEDLHLNYSAYYMRSAAYYFLKQYDQTIADISEYISMRPDDPDGYNNLGLCYLVLTRYDDAIAEFNKTIRLKPDYASAYADLGYAYMQQGKMKPAVENFNRCLEIDDKTFSTNLDLSIIYYLEGNLQESGKYLNVAKSLEPRISKGIDGIHELETEGYFWSEKDKETLKKIFTELK